MIDKRFYYNIHKIVLFNAQLLIVKPHRVFDLTSQQDFTSLFSESAVSDRIKLCSYHFIMPSTLRELNLPDIDTLLSVIGLVTRCDSILLDLQQAFFPVFYVMQICMWHWNGVN